MLLELPLLVFVSRVTAGHLGISAARRCAVGGDAHVCVGVVDAPILLDDGTEVRSILRLPNCIILSLLAYEGQVYLAELPEDAGRSVLAVAGAVPHSHKDLALEDLGAQLGHRVEADLLLRRVLEVLRQERDVKVKKKPKKNKLTL